MRDVRTLCIRSADCSTFRYPGKKIRYRFMVLFFFFMVLPSASTMLVAALAASAMRLRAPQCSLPGYGANFSGPQLPPPAGSTHPTASAREHWIEVCSLQFSRVLAAVCVCVCVCVPKIPFHGCCPITVQWSLVGRLEGLCRHHCGSSMNCCVVAGLSILAPRQSEVEAAAHTKRSPLPAGNASMPGSELGHC